MEAKEKRSSWTAIMEIFVAGYQAMGYEYVPGPFT